MKRSISRDVDQKMQGKAPPFARDEPIGQKHHGTGNAASRQERPVFHSKRKKEGDGFHPPFAVPPSAETGIAGRLACLSIGI